MATDNCQSEYSKLLDALNAYIDCIKKHLHPNINLTLFNDFKTKINNIQSKIQNTSSNSLDDPKKSYDSDTGNIVDDPKKSDTGNTGNIVNDPYTRNKRNTGNSDDTEIDNFFNYLSKGDLLDNISTIIEFKNDVNYDSSLSQLNIDDNLKKKYCSY